MRGAKSRRVRIACRSALHLYQPSGVTGLEPLTLLRPVSACLFGAGTIHERAARLFGAAPAALPGAPGLYLDARFLPDGKISLAGPEAAGRHGMRIAWLRLGAERARRFAEACAAHSDPARAAEELGGEVGSAEANGIFLEAPWDLVPETDEVLTRDLAGLRSARRSFPGVRTAGKPIAIHRSARLDPGVFLDARSGGILIEAGARIGANAVLEGPLVIGKNAVVRPLASLRASYIGEAVRVGGEVSLSTIYPFSNKSHHGFLGHSIVASWVNIGAGATVSNLKNTYGEIQSGWPKESRPTGRTFFGTVIADYVKVGINVSLTTGSIVGVAAHLFGTGPFPKAVPSFYWPGGWIDTEKAIDVARRMMARREIEMTPKQVEEIRAEAARAPARDDATRSE